MNESYEPYEGEWPSYSFCNLEDIGQAVEDGGFKQVQTRLNTFILF